MTEPLLNGINHVALACGDLDKTVQFYAEIFDLQPSGISVPGEQQNMLLFFPDSSFLHLIDGSADTPRERVLSPTGGNLIYEGDALDHIALFAANRGALDEIHTRLKARGASVGEVVDTGGVSATVGFEDPDGRRLEVTAYL
jgi:catechol 2,3-dioxygenase-like lactoylglutathione lyase family enzyme